MWLDERETHDVPEKHDNGKQDSGKRDNGMRGTAGTQIFSRIEGPGQL